MKQIISRAFTKDVAKLHDQKLLAKIRIVLEEINMVDSLHEISNLEEMTGYKGFYRIKLDYHYRIGVYFDGEILQVLRLGT